MHIERVLIVEDNKESAGLVAEILLGVGLKADMVNSIEEARNVLDASHYDLVLLDVRLPDGDGLLLLRDYYGDGQGTAFIVMSGYGTLEMAIQAMRLGAMDYLIKPFEPSQLEIAVKRADSWCRLHAENAYLRGEEGRMPDMIGNSEAMLSVQHLIRQVGPTQATVLIHGESGTGKELVARATVESSQRRNQPYVRLNCAAIPENLIESELFGHEKGSFTGATTKRRGRFEMADGGTILLDEISEIPLSLQAKLLRVLQEQEFERVGGGSTLKVDVRVLATSNRNLKEAVSQGRFREDLYFRLNVVPIHVPPLRERDGDIELLTGHFLKTFATRHGKPVPELDSRTMDALRQEKWPGNVRELQNSVERAVILMNPDQGMTPLDFGLADPSTYLSAPEPEEDEDLSLKNMEARMIQKALKRTGGNITHAAARLGLSVRALHYKLASSRNSQKSDIGKITGDVAAKGESSTVNR